MTAVSAPPPTAATAARATPRKDGNIVVLRRKARRYAHRRGLRSAGEEAFKCAKRKIARESSDATDDGTVTSPHQKDFSSTDDAYGTIASVPWLSAQCRVRTLRENSVLTKCPRVC